MPACQANVGYNYVFDVSTETGKRTLSFVLGAYVSEKPGMIWDYHNRDVYSGIESLQFVLLK